MAAVSRREGLFALESELYDSSNPFFLRLGIKLILDGAETDTLRKILETHIFAGDYSGFELLMRTVILEGLFMIRDCVSPSFIGERLYAFLGEDFHKLLDSKKSHDLDDFLDTIVNREPLNPETAVLETIFDLIDGKKISKILNSINTEKLALALEGSGGKVITEIFASIEEEKAMMLYQILRGNTASNTEVITAAQEEIRDYILDKLKNKRIFKL
jgi:hypothetical protein